MLVALEDSHKGVAKKNVSEKSLSPAGKTVAVAAVATVPPTVSNFKLSTTGSALDVRVGPGLVPGFAASPVSPRKCLISLGVTSGTVIGVSIATTRDHTLSANG